MASRRMFSNRIANSARFLQMPAESQLLYFHMVIRADDDGIVESYPLMKLLGVAPDNFKVLQAKGFIEKLNEDQVIVINDWQEHNKIRPDRKVDSIYLPLLLAKKPEAPIIAPQPRSDVKDNSKRVGGPSTVGLSKDSIGKVSIGKVNNNIISSNEKSLPVIANDLINLFEDVNPSYKRLFANKTERNAMERLIKQYGEDYIRRIVVALPTLITRPYAPKITTPYQLEKRMGELKAFVAQERERTNKGGVADGTSL